MQYIFRYTNVFFAEEQVDELQGKIRRLQEHVMRLSRENENLKHELEINVQRNDMSNRTKVPKLGSLEIYENQDNYQVCRIMLMIYV